MTEKLKPLFSFVLRFGLSFALLWLIFHFQKIDLGKITTVLKSADIGYLLTAGIFFVILNFVLLLRWFVYVWALELAAPVKVVTRYFFIGLFGNLFLPTSIGGDVIKILGLCQYTPQKPKVVASVLLDRLSGFAGIVILAIGAFAVGFRLINDVTMLVSIGLLALLSIFVGTLLFNEKLFSFFCQVFNRLPKIKKAFMNLHQDVALLKGRQYALYQGVGLSVLAQILAATFFFLIGKALQANIALIYFLIFVPLIGVASSVPSIGGLGVREAGMVYFLGKVGVRPETAVSIGLLNFFFMVLVGLIGGLVYLLTKNAPVPVAPAGVGLNA